MTARPTIHNGHEPDVSPAQHGLWLTSRMHPDSGLNNVFCTVRIVGPVDLTALRAALAGVVDRHEALRTTFHVKDGKLRPRVSTHVEALMPVVDVDSWPAAERAEQARRFARSWCAQPFDLAEGPLLRAQVVRIGPREHLLSVAVHHIVCDGRSLAVLFDELSLGYARLTGADPGAQPPALQAQYADYVGWRGRLARHAGTLAWWTAYLAEAPDLLPLPVDRPRPVVRGAEGATVLFDIPEPLVVEVVALANSRRMTPFMVLLAAYSVLLSRVSGVTDLMVGIPVTDRPLPEFEPLIGLFVDTLPVRVTVPVGATFADVLDGVRRSVLDVLSHQRVSFDELVDLRKPDRSPGHTPLVQVAFGADLSPFPAPVLAGVAVEVSIPEPSTAKFDLDVSFNASPAGRGGLVGALNYSTELFDRTSIDALVERFVRLLTAGVAEPLRVLATVPLINPLERTTILRQWGRGGTSRETGTPVHEMFARQAAATPHAPALSFDGQDVSYAELDARAERIGRHLRRAGLGPDDVVGVLQERGLDLVATLLGILKAGAAYLPLASTHPPAYLARVLAAAGSRYAVAAPDLVHRLAGAGVIVVTPEELSRDTTGPTPAYRRPDPGNLAYVLFTSGSTGEPKGVAITHRSVSNIASTMRDVYRLTAADRVLQFANIGFDIAVEEMFPTWAAGGCVVPVPEPPPDPVGLTRLMDRERVTFAILTSSSWRHWVTESRRRGVAIPPTLRLISVGAEPTDADTVRTWQRETGIPVFNAYGLTETTVNTTIGEVDNPLVGDRVGIGLPISGVDVYVLDAELEPVPPGVVGELYAAGDCLARGYLGRPDLTAARFVPHPFASVPGSRLHRTGDRARWRADGTLEVLGRLDEQLKVRGYRVEPGHVEAVIRSHPEVEAAAVAVRPGPDGQDRLVGYLVPREAGNVPAELRGHLAARLPAYLVPSALVVVATIPRNANGKLDTAALPEPTYAEVEHTPPRTELERLVLGVWRDVLDRPEVGVHENFFDSGGTSQALTTVLTMLNGLLERPLPLVSLYEFPTVAALAAHLSAEERADPATGSEPRRAERLRAGRARLAAHRRDRAR